MCRRFFTFISWNAIKIFDAGGLKVTRAVPEKHIINFLWPNSLYCGKCDLDLGPTMPNIELVRVIFIYYNVFKFHVPGSIPFLTYRAKTWKHGNVETRNHGNTQRLWRVLYSCVLKKYNYNYTYSVPNPYILCYFQIYFGIF